MKEKVLKGDLSYPFVWKSAEMGYDGYGVSIVHSNKELEELNPGHCLIEEIVKFKKELSVIVCRRPQGEMVNYPVIESEFHPTANQVEYVLCPARVSTKAAKNAVDAPIIIINDNARSEFSKIGEHLATRKIPAVTIVAA